MPAYLVTITMPDGSQGVHRGIYEDGFTAAESFKAAFPEAKRVSAQPLIAKVAHATPQRKPLVTTKTFGGARA